MKTADVIELTAWGAGTATIGALIAMAVLRALRRRGLAVQVAVVAAVPCVTALLGAWIGSRAMFLSAHDRTALNVLALAAGSVGALAALLIAGRLARTDDALRRAQRDQAVEASRRELVAWVSHDLRTPLAGIRAMAEALDDGVVSAPADVAVYHTRLRQESERLAALVDDLFALSRAHSRSVESSRVSVALDDLLSDAIAALAPVAAAKGVHVVDRGGDAEVALDVAAHDMVRALRNVLENAIRYTPSGRSVVVESHCVGGAALVTITDEGGGIEPQHLDRVFEPGFRGDAARTGGHAGGGLGLTIARAVVEAHRGTIAVADHNGGTRVTIELPATPR